MIRFSFTIMALEHRSSLESFWITRHFCMDIKDNSWLGLCEFSI